MEQDKSTSQIYKEDLILLDEYRKKNNIETRRDALHILLQKGGLVKVS